MRYFLTIILMIVLILAGSISCEPEVFNEKVIDEPELNLGTLEVHFDIKHSWIPADRIIRVGLHVAKSSMSIYTGDYLQSAYVTNSNFIYQFRLAPGTYYYDAVVACLCEQDSCLIGGFPGSQYSKKHSIGKIIIQKKETTIVKPSFN